MKRRRIVQVVKDELKGTRRKSKPELLDAVRKALARRGIKEK